MGLIHQLRPPTSATFNSYSHITVSFTKDFRLNCDNVISHGILYDILENQADRLRKAWIQFDGSPIDLDAKNFQCVYVEFDHDLTYCLSRKWKRDDIVSGVLKRIPNLGALHIDPLVVSKRVLKQSLLLMKGLHTITYFDSMNDYRNIIGSPDEVPKDCFHFPVTVSVIVIENITGCFHNLMRYLKTAEELEEFEFTGNDIGKCDCCRDILTQILRFIPRFHSLAKFRIEENLGNVGQIPLMLMKKMKNLVDLALLMDGEKYLTPPFLKKIAENNLKLRKAEIGYELDSKAINEFLQASPNLEMLTIQSSDLAPIEKWPPLKALKLRRLDFYSCSDVSHPWIEEVMSRAENLSDIYLEDNEWKSESSKQLHLANVFRIALKRGRVVKFCHATIHSNVDLFFTMWQGGESPIDHSKCRYLKYYVNGHIAISREEYALFVDGIRTKIDLENVKVCSHYF